MGTLEVFVGLDYHQSAVQVCVLDRQGKQLGNRSCGNDSAAIAEVVQRFGNQVQAAIEACCGAADLAEELIKHWGWSVDLAHPGFVARMKQNPDKTDFSDARLLADLERVGYLPRVWLAPEEVRELRRLVRYRQQLAGERRNLKLRLGALLRDQRAAKPEFTPWTKKWLRWLQAEAPLSAASRWIVTQQLRRLEQLEADITAAEEQLAQQTANDAMVQALRREKGVGLVTAVTVRAEIGRFDRFRTGKQLARFCGLSPRNASSGERQADAGLIKAGNPQLRGVLIELAHRLMRYDPRWRELGSSLRGRGKPGSVVAAAVANRWVRCLYHHMQPEALAA
jgi:transposase